jgi:CDP-6-deoxy-D-xylo-4-hexulose-3-dehydrase
MIVTNRTTLADDCRRRRAFGWVRGDRNADVYARQLPDIDPRFLFVSDGYNFRPTEIQGAFGMHRLPRLEGYIALRRDNMAYWNRELAKWQNWITLPTEAPNTRHVSFAYAVTVRPRAPFTAKALQAHLESCGVETRPIEAGDMSLQPAMKDLKWRSGLLPNARYIHRNSFFIGNHHGITHEQREAVVDHVDEFMRRS